MPVHTSEQVRSRIEALGKLIAEQGDSMEPGPRRAARKRLRRAQRKLRRIQVADAQRAERAAKAQASSAKPEPAEGESKPAAESGAASEETPSES
jgi:hypothetical protein